MWEVQGGPPSTLSAVYYLVLPDDNKVLYAYELHENTTPLENYGTFSGFKGVQAVGTPLIPVDTHHALLLGWVDIDTMARNRPYLDDAIKAAIALVA
jgi:hypothetical protein